MPVSYSIRDLEILSGIKAHTIRIWEQRYQILKAERTDTNIRIYSDADLKFLMSLAVLNKNGQKISKLAKLTHEDISGMVADLIHAPEEYSNQIEAMVLATIEYNESAFHHIINTCVLQLGFENTVKKVIFPFLEKIGILWVSGKVIAAQEHFMTQLIRQKFILAIDGKPFLNKAESKTFILFLPNSEWHELSLLFLNYLLRASNHKVIYLGPSVPINDVIQVGESIKPDAFYTVITTQPGSYTIADYLNKLAEHFSESKVFVSGPLMQHPPKDLRKNIHILNDMNTVLEDVASALSK